MMTNDIKGVKAMRTFEFKRVVTAMVGCMAMVGLASAEDHEACSNASLDGDFALRVSGEVFNATGDVVQRRDGIDMVEYDGAGHFTQKDFALANGKPTPGPTDSTGFHINEGGTYTVNPDCTGSATISFQSPGPGLSGAMINVLFVLSNHGHTMHQIVVSLTPPGPTGMQVAVPANIHADGEKLGSVPQVP